MNGQRVAAVVVLVGALFVLGTLSATMEGTVTSTPDDVIDVDTDALPFAGDGASEIADSYRQSPDGERTGDPAPAEEGAASSAASEPDSGGESGSGGDSDAGSGGPDGDQSQGASEQGQREASSQEQSGQGAGADGPSLWDLLAQYLVVVLALLALLALLVLGRALARRRERLLARLRALADRLGLLPADEPAGDVAVPDGEGEAATVVERAWGEMLQASGANPPPSDTPRECARQVIEQGADREPVEGLTGMYEQVRYGDGSITADEASRALEYARESTPGDGASIDAASVDGDAATAGSTDAAAGGRA